MLDPSFAPGTGTPEAGGLSSRELLRVLRGLTDVNLVSADLVEVSPAYDHAEITAIAAATVIFDIIALLARRVLWLLLISMSSSSAAACPEGCLPR